LFRALGRLYPKLDWAPKVLRAKSTLEAIGRDGLEGYFHSVTIMPAALRARLFSAAFRSQLQGYEALHVFKRYSQRAPSDALSLVQYLDYKTYLPGDILTKVDRASMAHSLEVRVPILDHELVDWVASVDPKLKLNGGEGKYFFKKALEPHLPNDVLYRPKMGFAVPLAQWFRREIKDQARSRLLADDFLGGGMFDRDFVKRMLDEHASGARDFSAPLWALLMFDGFQRKVLGSAA
jgi:asparagine synthase (glutamine-hydrolysing)